MGINSTINDLVKSVKGWIENPETNRNEYIGPTGQVVDHRPFTSEQIEKYRRLRREARNDRPTTATVAGTPSQAEQSAAPTQRDEPSTPTLQQKAVSKDHEQPEAAIKPKQRECPLKDEPFGLLKVIGWSEKRGPKGVRMVDVRCECGVVKSVAPGNLRAGNTRSCGSRIHREKAKPKAITPKAVSPIVKPTSQQPRAAQQPLGDVMSMIFSTVESLDIRKLQELYVAMEPIRNSEIRDLNILIRKWGALLRFRQELDAINGGDNGR